MKTPISYAYMFLCIFFIAGYSFGQTVTGPRNEIFSVRVVKNLLGDPWEIIYGPDNYLWVTEARGYKVSRIDPATGTKTVILDLNSMRNFPRYDILPTSTDGDKPWPQGGLMGLALHPDLLGAKPYVYLAYIHTYAGSGASSSSNGCTASGGGCFFTTRVVRYTYNSVAQTLSSPVTLCDTIPGSSDHNSGRMIIAPFEGTDYLFYSVGDMGSGQFASAARAQRAQDTLSYQGKILRFNLEADGDAGATDKWIPDDNPFNGVKESAVWSIGHRNPQGLKYAVIKGVGRIYSSEHGPFSDDEINIIDSGKNYGHPLVVGYNDGNYNSKAAGASNISTAPGTHNSTCPIITSENTNALAIGDSFTPPVFTMYAATSTQLNTPFNNTIAQGYDDNNPWKSEGPSGMDVYTSTSIPGWQNSLLITTLKGGKLVRIKLNEDGDELSGDTINYFKAANRYRDVAISTDGTKIYLAVDSSAVTSGPTSTNPQVSTNRGSILEFTYVSGGSLPLRNRNNRPQEENKYEITIYPNPAGNTVTVDLDKNMRKPYRYQLFDLSGKLVLENSTSKNIFSIDVAPFNRGVYVIRIYNGLGVEVDRHKIVLQ